MCLVFQLSVHVHNIFSRMPLPLSHLVQARRALAPCLKKHEGRHRLGVPELISTPILTRAAHTPPARRAKPANCPALTNATPQADETKGRGVSDANAEECHHLSQREVCASLTRAADTNRVHKKAVGTTAEQKGALLNGAPSGGGPRDTGGSVSEGRIIWPTVKIIQRLGPQGHGQLVMTTPLPSPAQVLGAEGAARSPEGTNLLQKNSISLLQLGGADAEALETNQNDVDDITGTEEVAWLQIARHGQSFSTCAFQAPVHL